MLFKTNPALACGLCLFSLTMLLNCTVGLPHWLTILLLVVTVILELAGVVHNRRSLVKNDERDLL